MSIFQNPKITWLGKEYDASHGSPFDRGMADSHYGRKPIPNNGFGGSSKHGTVNTTDGLTTDEVFAYHAGYDFNELHGDKKSFK